MGGAGVSLHAVASGTVRPYRLAFVRRLVAAILVASLGLPLVPAVGAQGGAPSLVVVLDDAEAFEQALAAARAAAPGSAPLAVFAETYADAVGDVSVEALVQMLGQSSLSGVLPPAHDEAVASSKLATPASASAVALSSGAALDAPATSVGDAAVADDDVPPRPVAPSARPRAP